MLSNLSFQLTTNCSRSFCFYCTWWSHSVSNVKEACGWNRFDSSVGVCGVDILPLERGARLLLDHVNIDYQQFVLLLFCGNMSAWITSCQSETSINYMWSWSELLPSHLLDNNRVMVIVWRLSGNIIRTALYWIVWHQTNVVWHQTLHG